MKNIICFTNDVETTSIVNGGLRPETGLKVWKEGLPLLLDIYARHEIQTTFFVVADFAYECPEIVRMLLAEGHEVGLHGLTHDHRRAFDNMSLEEQIHDLREGKKILEDIGGAQVISFRAPALRVNEFTPQALLETGFKFDSSVAPQRIDMFMSLGSRKKLAWLKAPRKPYYVRQDNLARKGKLPIIEVPVSSFGIPYIGTFMRISPILSSCVRQLLYWETKNTNKPVNFLIHPNEVITEPNLNLKKERRASNYVAYLLSDVLRYKLKLRNLGLDCLQLFEQDLKFWRKHNYRFTRIQDIQVSN